MSDVGNMLGLASILLAGASLAMRGSSSRDEGCRIFSLNQENEEDAEAIEAATGQDFYNFLDECDAMFHRMEIRTSRDEHLYEACVTPDKVLQGVTAVAEKEDYTTFSIVVAETARGQGVATRLIESLLKQFLGDSEVRAWVVNPHMAKLLATRFGFEAEGRNGEWSENAPHMTAPHNALEHLRAWRKGSRALAPQADLLLVRAAISKAGFRPKDVMASAIRGRAHDPHQIKSVEVVVSAPSAGALDCHRGGKLEQFVLTEARKAGMRNARVVIPAGRPQASLHGRQRLPGWRRNFEVTS